MTNWTSLVIGQGEVGQALYEVLKETYPNIVIRDKWRFQKENEGLKLQFDILHICFPYFDGFVEQVKKYQKEYSPKYTIIHSSVPIGTSRKCNAIHSLIRGRHPNLKKGIKTYTKFLGGEQANEIADYFRNADLKVHVFEKQEASEAPKIFSNILYGVVIEFVKDVKRQFDKYEIPFNAWELLCQDDIRGMEELKVEKYVKVNIIPVMERIGGHCILENCDLVDTNFTRLLKELNGIQGKKGINAEMLFNRREILTRLIRENNYKNIAEIGTLKGEVAKEIVTLCNITKFISVDIKKDNSFDKWIIENKKPIEYIIKPSVEAAKFVKDRSLDLVFIDADHSYEHVLEDIRVWLPKIRKGGIISGHDYDYGKKFAGVTKAVDESFNNINLELDADGETPTVKVWWKEV